MKRIRIIPSGNNVKTKNIRIKRIILNALLSVIWIPGMTQNKNHLSQNYLSGNNPVADSLIQEKLVALALEGPGFKTNDNEITKNKLLVKKAKNSWFDLLSISTNYNDQTFAKSTANAAYIYPKYFFGLTIPLGMFFSKGADIKGAKENVKISEHTKEEERRKLRSDIISKYKQYKVYFSLIVLQSNLTDEQQALLLQSEKLFADGKISIESYSNTSRNFVTQKASVINLQLQQDLLRIEIERIIGMDLDTAIAQATGNTPN